MKQFLLTAFIFGCTSLCYAQKEKATTTVVKFTPPVIVKDAAPARHQKKDKVTFTPPVIKKDVPVKARKPKESGPVKFKPPVIVKD